jgi:hypothetical protein
MGQVWDILEPRNLELGPVSLGAPSPWRHWKLARDEDGIAWLIIDKRGASANTLSEDVLVELNNVLGELERDPPKGLVLRSAKRGGFIAGADIGEFRGMTDVAAIETRLTVAHGVVDRLDQLKVPTVRWPPSSAGRDRARLRSPDRARGRTAGISRGDARPASQSRRHGPLAPADQSGRGDDPDADGAHLARRPRQVARPGRRGDP